MKKILLLLLLCWCSRASSQQLAVGDQMPDIILGYTLAGDILKTSSFEGKLLIIEFWATWCSPCIEALSHLEKSKHELGNQLEVLAISDESGRRLQKFVKARPTRLTIGRDTTGDLRKYFPYRTIPHTVLIGPDRKIYAITDASNITTNVLKAVLNKMPIELPLKKDFVDFDINTYFGHDSTKLKNFSLLPAVEGVGPQSISYKEGPFKDRRITMVNFTRDMLFQMAYKKTNFSTVNEYDTTKRNWNQEEKYCLDVWIEESDDSRLLHFIQEELNKHFIDIEASIEKRNKTVLILQSANASQSLKPSKNKNERYSYGGDHFNGDGVTLNQLAEYIENVALYKGNVVNETGIEGHYDIKLQFQPEIKDAFKNELANLGLHISEAERTVELLVLKKK